MLIIGALVAIVVIILGGTVMACFCCVALHCLYAEFTNVCVYVI